MKNLNFSTFLSRRHSVKVERFHESRVIIIDVRPYNDFKLGALPGSLNCPVSSCLSENGQVTI